MCFSVKNRIISAKLFLGSYRSCKWFGDWIKCEQLFISIPLFVVQWRMRHAINQRNGRTSQLRWAASYVVTRFENIFEQMRSVLIADLVTVNTAEEFNFHTFESSHVPWKKFDFSLPVRFLLIQRNAFAMTHFLAEFIPPEVSQFSAKESSETVRRVFICSTNKCRSEILFAWPVTFKAFWFVWK